MALGALTLVEKIDSQGPVFHCRCNLVGDSAYSAGGSTGLLAKLRTLLDAPNLNILAVVDQTAPGVGLNEVSYDHANEKLFMRVRTTGVESADSDQSDVTYGLYIVAG